MSAAVEARGLSVVFDQRSGAFGAPRRVVAVDDLSLSVPEGSAIGIVGESGCGKSTLARALLGLQTPTGGSVRIGGQALRAMDRRARARLIQPVFQDPAGSLNPRRRVGETVALPLSAVGGTGRAARRERVMTMLQRVGLGPEIAARYPAQLSGGQRQRVAIARALILQPRILVCDEPTSALDVSVQAQILNLLAELRAGFNLTLIFISHNLAVVEHIADLVAVMYLGRIVERGPAERVFRRPLHPYTRALLASVLTPEPGLGLPEIPLGESNPDPADIPPGCRFHPRCPVAVPRCRSEAPAAGDVECHLAHLAEADDGGGTREKEKETGMKRRTFLGTAAAAAAVLPSLDRSARAQKSDDTLRITWRDAIPDVDPYRNSLRTGLIVAHHAWDTLVYRVPSTFENVPLLASEWTLTGPTTLRFTLREGVKFHNGDPFGADDVVYTFNTILTDPMVSVPSNFAFIKGVKKLNDHQVEVEMKSIFPAAIEYFAMVLPIYPKMYREKVGPAGYSQKPIGAGPYRITRVDGSSAIDMERFEGYYAASPKGRPAIKSIKITEVLDAASELTAFIGGEADWIWQYNPDEFNNLKALPSRTAVRSPSMRIGYLSIDAAGRTGKDNPLTKLKVRQAICYAVDRTAMAKDLVQGGSEPIAAPCYPNQFGCDEQAAVKYPYDPAKAKALLAAAGYPHGFDTTLVSYLLPSWNAAIQNYLKAVGINADIQQLQVGAAIQKVNSGQAPLDGGSWGSYSINDVSAILPYFFGGGPADYARDPELEKLIRQGGSVNDPKQRLTYYDAAIGRISAQAYWLPLFTFVDYYAFDQDLKFQPWPDELPRFFLSSWS
ncbi:MAG TPA: oligopeptide/dipeptide ABC transporter ATP-binding protein [Acetobacteraceae bacterium]|nr:oligopeptide/dipeptide ABC transporter ATP-binding protein [Acetobacteraceae bacterium]